MTEHETYQFPKTRIATIDICEIGRQKHHIAALIELDVSGSREKIRKYIREHTKISFTAWLIKAISITIEKNKHAAAYLQGKQKLIVFNNINVSMIVEKELNGQKIPIPLIIEKAHEKSIGSITKEIRDARNEQLTEKDIVLQKKTSRLEALYYYLPGFIRNLVWRYMLSHPRLAFTKMGNVAITSIGMMGKIHGWFIPISIRPICFGISTITKKPIVVDNSIEIREILNMTILLDHDVIDGAFMARFISDLSKNIENGIEL